MAMPTLEGKNEQEIEWTQQHKHKVESEIDRGTQFFQLYHDVALFACVVKGEG